MYIYICMYVENYRWGVEADIMYDKTILLLLGNSDR